MIKKVRLLQIQFSSEIKRYELPAFRAAIAEKAGKEHVLFHNHTETGFRQKYPLIQYKSINGKPAIICLEEAVEEIHHFFKQQDWSIKIGTETREMKIDGLNLNQFTMQVWDKKFKYSIINWLALNQENFKKYQELTGVVEKNQFLEQKLTGNILSFAKGIEWTIEKQIELKITENTGSKILPHKGVKLMAFNLEFETNVFLPNFLGLGKGAGFGFGTVKQMMDKKTT
jgi:hypothetical protein